MEPKAASAVRQRHAVHRFYTRGGKNKSGKKILSILLAIALALSLMPTSALADGEDDHTLHMGQNTIQVTDEFRSWYFTPTDGGAYRI